MAQSISCPGSQRFVAVLSIALLACTSRAPQAITNPVPRGTDLSAEMLLAELDPRGGGDLIQAWNGTDPEAVASVYTEDAVVIMTNGTVYRGRTAILDGWLRQLVPIVSGLTPTIEQVVGGPERMTLIGTYTALVSSPGELPFDAAGIFGNTWVRQSDGRWKIKASIASMPVRED